MGADPAAVLAAVDGMMETLCKWGLQTEGGSGNFGCQATQGTLMASWWSVVWVSVLHSGRTLRHNERPLGLAFHPLVEEG